MGGIVTCLVYLLSYCRAPHLDSIFHGDDCYVDNICSNDAIKYDWEKLTKFLRNVWISKDMNHTKITRAWLFYLRAKFAAKMGKTKKEYTKSRRHKEIMKGIDGLRLVFGWFKRANTTTRFSLIKNKNCCLLLKIILFHTQFQILQKVRRTLKHLLIQLCHTQTLLSLKDLNILFP